MADFAGALKRLPARVLEMAGAIAKRREQLSLTQEAVANWLRGNNRAYGSLKELITARIQARGLSPVPTEPVAALIDKARDNECLRILRELETILKSPIPSLNPGDEEE